MKTALVCALLVLVPFSGLRMVCFTTHPAELRTGSGAQAAAAGEPDETECQRICTHRPAEPKPAAAVSCVLLADPACEWLTTAGAAVMPPAPLVISAAGVAPFELPASAEYASPLLARHSPPPRS